MLQFLDEFADNPEALVAYFAAFAVAFITGIAFHEFSHAWAAYQLGDDTAARRGRLTLNPIKHLDPMGTVLLALMGFGWGKPTPVSLARLRHGPKVGGALVALAGPASNFAFAIIAALPLRLGLIDSVASFDQIDQASGAEIVGLFLVFVVWINVILGVFNLLPIPILDGFSVWTAFLPRGPWVQAQRFQASYGVMILIGVFLVGLVLPGNPLGEVLVGIGDPIFDYIT
ncbi:MAG: site-2 protease family protein [Dehalococcoidia bacterium]